jgi:hypothetical protein
MIRRLSRLSFIPLMLSACVSTEQLQQEALVGQQDGHNLYRFWVYMDYQVKGNANQLCPQGGWKEVSREQGESDLRFAGGVPIRYNRKYVTISCPV